MADHKTHKPDLKVIPMVICILVALAICFVIPKPQEVSTQGWNLLGIFVATILGLIIKPLPLGALSMVSMAVLCVSGVMTRVEVFSSYSNAPVWLVIMASFIAKGFSSTGLGRRLAYLFTSIFGRTSLGISYSLVATDLFLAPVIPSVTARAAGVVLPILEGISSSYKSFPKTNTANYLGKFLILVSFQAAVVTSAMFLTAIISNPMIVALLDGTGIELDWVTWAKAAIVPGLISLACIPLVVYFIYPPELKYTPKAPEIAREKLEEMGSMKSKEIVMCITVLGLLVLWAGSKYFGISILVSAMVGLSILLIFDVLHWHTILKDDVAWDTFIWFGALIMMAEGLAKYGVIAWFSSQAELMLGGVSWEYGLPIIVLLYFYSHYFFASSTAHVSSMFIPMLTIALSMGAPAMLAAFSLTFTSSLMAGLTHYGCTPAPILFSVGYSSLADWWKTGLLVSIINILIWGFVGAYWWKIIGIW